MSQSGSGRAEGPALSSDACAYPSPNSVRPAELVRASSGLERWLYAGLVLWGVGVQSLEALASVGMAMCATGIGFEALRKGSARSAGEWLRAWAPLVAFLTWSLLAPLLAGHVHTSTAVARLGDWLAIPIAARALAVIGPARWRGLVLALGGTFLLSCVVAGFQHFGVWPKPEFFAPLAWTRHPFHRVYEAIPGAPGRFMGGGLISHRLKFAHVGGLLVLFFLVLGLKSKGWARALGLGVAGAGFASVLVFPYARMASAALCASALVATVIAHPRRRMGVLLGAGLLALAGAVVALDAPLRARFLSAATASGSGERGELLQTGLRAIRAHPLAGVGLGQFRPSRFAVPSTPQLVLDNPGKAHNQFVSVAAEVGVPGLLLFVILLAALGRAMRVDQMAGAVGISALVFFTLLSATHDPLFQAPFSMGLALALGAGLVRGRMPGMSSMP